MPIMELKVGYDVWSDEVKIKNFRVGASVTNYFYEERTKGVIKESEKRRINSPDWSYQVNTGIPSYFAKENGFHDQELYMRKSKSYVIRQGTNIKYYTTSFDPYLDPIRHEDVNRTVERYFDIPILLSFQPENDIYDRYSIQHTDEMEFHIHMMLFLELNYASLVKHCVQPLCPPTEHNPVWYQRGYEEFRFHGYTFDQIGPKPGDYFKIEAFNTLYKMETVKDASPEYQHRGRKYWWKAFAKVATDNASTISDDVANDIEQEGFIQQLFGNQVIDPTTDTIKNSDAFPFDSTCSVNKVKKDILFRPPEVPHTADDISQHPNFHPCGDKFGVW